MENSVVLSVLVQDRRTFPARNRNEKPMIQATVAGVGFATRIGFQQGHPALQLLQLGQYVRVTGQLGPEGRIIAAKVEQDKAEDLLNEVKFRAVVNECRTYDARQEGEDPVVSVTVAGLGFTTRFYQSPLEIQQKGIRPGIQIDFLGRLGADGRVIADSITIPTNPDKVSKQVLDAVAAKAGIGAPSPAAPALPKATTPAPAKL